MKKAFLILGFILLPLAPIHAAEPIGTIVSAEGICDIARQGALSQAAVEDTPVYSSDRLRTKSYSKMKIVFADESVLKLAPNTSVTVEEYLVAAGKRQNARLRVTRGKVEAVVAKTGKPDTFTIDTPNAKGSVKGSDIFVSFQAGRSGFFVKEGAMTVVNPLVSGAKTKLGAGEAASVALENKPTDARAALEAEMDAHKKDVETALVKAWIPSEDSPKMNASVVSAAGEARIHKAGADDWAPVKAGDVLSEGDKLQTGADGRIELRTPSGNALFIQENTEIGLKTFRVDKKSGLYDNRLEMKKGKISGIVNKVQGSTFKVETPVAIATVRGTFIQVTLEPASGSGPAVSQVFFEGGIGDVQNPISGLVQPVGAGQNVTSDGSGTLSQPEVTTAEERAAMSESWSDAQSSDQMSSDPAASGDAGDTGLPGGEGIDSLDTDLGDSGDISDIADSLTFDRFVNQADDGVFDEASLVKTLGTTANISAANILVKLFDDGTWEGDIHGHYIANIGSPWILSLDNADNDKLEFTMTGSMNITGGSGSFQVTSLDPPKDTVSGQTLTLDAGITGNWVGNGSDGDFSADVTGTWS